MTGNREKTVLVLILALGLFVRYAVWNDTRFCDDDAYITFRYAENLAHGHGFVYNLGERVLGTTTPLYTLLLAVGVLAGAHLPTLSFGLALCSYAVAGYLLFRILERSGHPVAGLLATTMHAASLCGTLMAEIGGLETSFFVALVMGALHAHSTERRTLAALLAGLAVLTRPEGVLLAVALGIARILEERRFPWREALVFSVLVLPWVAFSTYYFGSPIPNSALAKHAFFEKHWTRSALDIVRTFNSGKTRIVLNLLALGGAVPIVLRLRALLPVVLWLAFYLSFYVCGRVLVQYWYIPPYFVPLEVPAALAIGLAAGWIERRFRSGTGARVAMSACFLAVVARGARAIDISRREIRDGQLLLDQAHRSLALWIEGRTLPGVRVYCMDIGYVGYFGKRRLLDPVGLVSPESIPWISADDPVGLIRSERPEVCVIAMYGIDYSRILADPWFQGAYERVHRVSAACREETGWDEGDPRRELGFIPDYVVFVSSRDVLR
jgi:arabinofuranosyltransferase